MEKPTIFPGQPSRPARLPPRVPPGSDRGDGEAKAERPSRGLHFERHFATPGSDPFAEVSWEKRRAVILDEQGKVVFEQEGVEVPSHFSQLACDIIASKYMRKTGVPSVEGRETSARQVIFRIAHTIRSFGEAHGYFADRASAEDFEADLSWLLLHQAGAFNSPVWFNCGLWHEYKIRSLTPGQWAWDFEKASVVPLANVYERPQCSACFIQSVEDDLMSIYELLKTEARLFKFGSGTGSDFSRLRSKYERLSGGGTSSGLMSFLEVFDKAAGATKSGGVTRRAAKMVVVRMDHPEIEEFIDWKVKEERKARALIESLGLPADFNGEAYKTVSGQNSNNSVRIPDSFMEAYLADSEWQTRYVTTGEVHKSYKARELMDRIAQAAWECADPGVQYDDTIQRWNTCKNSGLIWATNPCAEFVFLDDTACNLASLNLIKFCRSDGSFDIERFREAVRIFITAMEIVVDLSSYPTQKIAQNSHDFRPLGLGYANLGTLLMTSGIPYDSKQGRALAAAITALMTAEAYKTSAEIAARVSGPFPRFSENRESFLEVMRLHRDAASKIPEADCPAALLEAARTGFDEAIALGERYGFRNAQVSVIAPTGTIALVMGCDTTGIEPDFALVKFKKLAGGGYFRIVNQAVPKALRHLGYSEEQVSEITTYIVGTGTLKGAPSINPETLQAKGLSAEAVDRVEANLAKAFDIELAFAPGIVGEEELARLGISKEMDETPGFSLLRALGYTEAEIVEADSVIFGRQTIEGAPHIASEHLPVFDCANRCGRFGTRFISPMGHIRMIAAIQPFLSGAASKTVNVPADATVEEIKNLYVEAWKLGIKNLSIYRDGSKRSQPLSTAAQKEKDKAASPTEGKPIRRRLPPERQSLTHKFSVGGAEGYLTVGLYDDGKPGEIFIRMAKQGSTISGLMDSFAIAVSIALQYGVPLTNLCTKFTHVRFDPAGVTENPKIRFAQSVIDYIFRWLALRFLSHEERARIGFGETESTGPAVPLPLNPTANRQPPIVSNIRQPTFRDDAPACPDCGGITSRTGTCYKCDNCGSTLGCS